VRVDAQEVITLAVDRRTALRRFFSFAMRTGSAAAE
jgi:hypothetical protein